MEKAKNNGEKMMKARDWLKGFVAVTSSILWLEVMLVHVPIGCAGFVIHFTLGEMYCHYLRANNPCPICGSRRRRLINTCVLYDKYYVCKKCGHCDFSESRMLTPKQNLERMRGILG